MPPKKSHRADRFPPTDAAFTPCRVDLCDAVMRYVMRATIRAGMPELTRTPLTPPSDLPVRVWRNGAVEILYALDFNRRTPSVAAYIRTVDPSLRLSASFMPEFCLSDTLPVCPPDSRWRIVTSLRVPFTAPALRGFLSRVWWAIVDAHKCLERDPTHMSVSTSRPRPDDVSDLI